MTNRLKSLELQGYKTFANKTSFEFPGQVTAIVGPNGSGKSNIADAVRWVLGEQAYTILRGKKTTDMIFSGSEQKPRASMAAVSIGFDNQSNWLPIDYSEVLITRRAYRNGENEYLLNNQKVRLKEINELLANSGLGDRTYTIIGQGLVDSALSLRPEERRKFFEEAAGIGLYRSRREEAINKLDKTLRNMERVEDIIGELTPRLKSLEKSREKTLQHKQIQDDLFILLKDWYGYHWHTAMHELKNAVSFYDQQKQRFELKRNEKDGLEENLNKVQRDLNENREKLADLHRELSELHRLKEEDTRHIAVLEERKESLKIRLQDVNATKQNVELDMESAKAELFQLQEQHRVFSDELKSVEIRLKIAEEGVAEKIRRQAELESALALKRQELTTCQTRILRLETDHTIHQENIQQIENNINVTKKFLEEKNQERTCINSSIEKITKNIDDLEKEKNQLKNVIDQQNKTIEIQKQNRVDLQKAIQEIEIQRSRYNAELALIIEDEKNLSDFKSGLHAILEAQKMGKLTEKFQILISHLNIPEKYELCVSAILGDLVEAIILEKQQNPDKILNFITQEKLSRTSIIQPTASFAQEKPGKTGMLGSDLIESDGVFALRIKELLSNSIIVEDSKSAFDLLPDLNPGWKIATLDGTIFEANGVITAGKPVGLKPVARKRERKSIENHLKKIEHESQSAHTKLDRLMSELQKNEEEIQVSLQKSELSRQEQQNIKLELHKKELELSQIEKVISDKQEQLVKDENQIRLLLEKIPQIESKIDLEKDSFHLFTSEEEKLRGGLQRINIESERMELVDVSSQKAVAEELVNQNARKMHEIQSIIEDLTEKIEKHTNIANELTENLERTLSEKQQLIEKNSANNICIEDLNKRIKPLNDMVELVIGEQSKILEGVDRVRQDFSVSERHLLQSQMKVEKLENNLDLLRSRIVEDFGIISGESDTFIPMSVPLPFEELSTSLPIIEHLPDDFEETIKQKKSFLRRIGPVNPDADREYDEVSERFIFLREQLEDLKKAEGDLRKVVSELDILMESKFKQTFSDVDKEFQIIFSQLFNGGTARLYVEEEDHVLDAGIEIEATLPGRRKQELALLSGGERSLTAVALIFALLRISPTPFCILDEVDAMLDESNVVRFGELLRELSSDTQFIVITHNRNTVQLADVLYGVTMGRDSVSQVISLRLDELTDEMVQ